MYQIKHFYFAVKETLDDTINRYAILVSKGKHKYFDDIDEHIRPTITRQTYRYPFTFEDRKDIVQDLMEAAFRRCFRYQPELGHYRHYTYRVTKYELIRMYHRVFSESQNATNKSNYTGTFSVGDYASRKKDNPLDIIVFEEGEEYLLNERGPCTRLERKVYHYYNQGYKVREIGDTIGMTEKIVRNTLYRAKVKAMKVHD